MFEAHRVTEMDPPRLFAQTSSADTRSPVRDSFSTRLPPLYADDTKRR